MDLLNSYRLHIAAIYTGMLAYQLYNNWFCNIVNRCFFRVHFIFCFLQCASDSGFVMKTLRNFRPGLQQALYDKHTLLQLAEELNKKHLINMDAFITVQAKDSREGSNIVLNLIEMKVAQQPQIYEEVIITMKQISSLGKVFEEFEVEKKFTSDNDIGRNYNDIVHVIFSIWNSFVSN